MSDITDLLLFAAIILFIAGLMVSYITIMVLLSCERLETIRKYEQR